MRRIERLINLIAALLETERPLTAAEIRERIAGYDQETHEAFRRAFERDKEHLRDMGIPLETIASGGDPSEQPDGYMIPKTSYYLPDLNLEEDELAALRLASELLAGTDGAGANALLKLAVDAGPLSDEGPRVRWGADLAAEQPHLGPIYGALLKRAPVGFSYRPANRDPAERVLETYALIHRRGSWYAIGRDLDREAIRAFKLSRIEGEVKILDGLYEVPADFDPADHLKGEAYEILGGGDAPLEAKIRLAPNLRWWVEQNMPTAETSSYEDGAVQLTLPITNVEALVTWVLTFGADAEIIEPAEAREALVRHLTPLAGEGR